MAWGYWVGFDLTSKINVAAEYYGATGTIRSVAPIADQEHMLFGAVNLDLGPAWEFNLAYGNGLTGAGDQLTGEEPAAPQHLRRAELP